MAEENQNLTWGQVSQQSQWNMAQNGDNFQLDFWDNTTWEANSWETSDLDIATSLDAESKQDNSEFDIDLWSEEENSNENWENSSLDTEELNWITPEDSEAKDDSFEIDLDTQDTEEGISWKSEESNENVEINLEDEVKDNEENNFDQTSNDEILDSLPEENNSDNWLNDSSSDSANEEEIIADSELLDTENDNTDKQSDDVSWFEDKVVDSNENNEYNLSDTNGEENDDFTLDVMGDSKDETDLSDEGNLPEWSENLNLSDEEEIASDSQNELLIEWDKNDSSDQLIGEVAVEDNSSELENEKVQDAVENADTIDNSESLEENIESHELLDDADVGKTPEEVNNTWLMEDTQDEVPWDEMQDTTSEGTQDFTLDLTWDLEENSEPSEKEQWNILSDEEGLVSNEEDSVPNETPEIDFSDDGENWMEDTVTTEEKFMADETVSSSEDLNESTQWEDNLLGTSEVVEDNSNPVLDNVDDNQINSNTDGYSLDENTVVSTNVPELNAVTDENAELNNTVPEFTNDSPELINDNEWSQPDTQNESINVTNVADENNGFTYEENNNQDTYNSKEVVMTDLNVEETQTDDQTPWGEAEQNSSLPENSYNPDIINENQIKENQTEEVVNENTNTNMQATLSLDEILDSELLTNPQFADNSKAIPENVQVSSWGLFSNKKILGIAAWVWIFLLAWFVVVLAFPFNNPNRPSDEVVVTPPIESESKLDIERLDTDNNEHGSATTWINEEEPLFDYDTWDNNEELYNNENPTDNNPNNNNSSNPTSVVVFPDVDWDDGWDSEEPVPYVSDWEDVTENSDKDKNEENQVSPDEVKKLISSFKKEAEWYYSYGQEVSDNNIMKYSRQAIYLCDSYQQKIDNWEWLNEKSVADFTMQINEKLAKIEREMNWWDEDVTTVESFEHDSDYDELKAYIENRQ